MRCRVDALAEIVNPRAGPARHGRAVRRLYLLRHAKSDWADPNRADFDRPLAARGSRDAPRMGAYLAGLDTPPELVLCSAARRARETWELVRPAFPDSVRCEIRRDLYLATPGDLLHAVNEVDAGVSALMLIGHNPGLHELALALADASASDLDWKFPTGAVAAIAFEGDGWADATPGGGRLEAFVVPRRLG